MWFLLVVVLVWSWRSVQICFGIDAKTLDDLEITFELPAVEASFVFGDFPSSRHYKMIDKLVAEARSRRR